MKKTKAEKRRIWLRAKSILSTFKNPSMFTAIKYILFVDSLDKIR